MMKTRNLGAPPLLTMTLMECGDTASVRKPNRNHRNLGDVRNHTSESSTLFMIKILRHSGLNAV